MSEINFNRDYYFNFTATLVAVTDTELWLSAEATGGDSTDSIIINWTAGNRDKSLRAMYDGYSIRIGDVIRVKGERGHWGKVSWAVAGKIS